MRRKVQRVWHNKRRDWTRCVRWYENLPATEPPSICLRFDDRKDSLSLYYHDTLEAQAAFDAFCHSDEPVAIMRNHIMKHRD